MDSTLQVFSAPSRVYASASFQVREDKPLGAPSKKVVLRFDMSISNPFVFLLLVVLLIEALFSMVGVFILVYEKPHVTDTPNDLEDLGKNEDQDKGVSYLILKDIVIKEFIQNTPTFIGIGTILISIYLKSNTTQSLGFFIIGFTGILRMILHSRYIPSEYYLSTKMTISNVLLTLFAWGFSIYSLFSK